MEPLVKSSKHSAEYYASGNPTDQYRQSRRPLIKLKDGSAPKIWIDLDNSPHVPFFVPIIDELENCGFKVILTARDSSNVNDLLRLFKLRCRIVGGPGGRNKFKKVAATCWRSLQLMRIAIAHKPDLAVSHGSRSQVLTCMLLGIPSIIIFDYEFANFSIFKFARLLGKNWLMAPEVISGLNQNGHMRDDLLHYPGIKEDVYVPRFKPDAGIKHHLELWDNLIVVTARPPANDAHYFNPESEKLFSAAMEFLTTHPETKIVLLPRNHKQAAHLRERWGSAFASGKVTIPDSAVDGLNLIWHSDLVISGGGTMNREAAALGVPVYSVYRGRIGAVDQYLARINRLVLIESTSEVEHKILLKRRSRAEQPSAINSNALGKIIDNIGLVLRSSRELAH